MGHRENTTQVDLVRRVEDLNAYDPIISTDVEHYALSYASIDDVLLSIVEPQIE